MMKLMRGVFAVAAVSLVACGPESTEQDVGLNVDEMGLVAGAVIQDHFIIQLRDGVDPAGVAALHGLSRSYTYRNTITGFAAFVPPGRLAALMQDPDVLSVEQDGVASIYAQTIPWGISNIGATTNSTLAGNGSGTVTGPTVFIIDTGIAAHADLNLVGHVNYAGGQNSDCHGHGTHVAGTVAARDNAADVVGVAPGVAVFGVKVLGCNGSGTWSGIISGMDYVGGRGEAGKVANMSLGGSKNQSVNDAAARLVTNNVATAVAAGNSAVDASTFSPASEPTVLTVAAYDSANRDASFTNYGNLVDLSAPGVSVLSTARGGGTTTMSGTSMASPHVAGALALYRANNPSASATTAQNAVKANTSGTTISRGFGRLNVANW